MTVRPSAVRVTSSAAGSATRAVADWVGSAAPHPAGYQSGFTTGYLDPQEARTRLDALAAEFSALTTPVNLPELSSGYRRKAQWVFGTATPYAGETGSLTTAEGGRAVILTSKADGDEGGNTSRRACSLPARRTRRSRSPSSGTWSPSAWRPTAAVRWPARPRRWSRRSTPTCPPPRWSRRRRTAATPAPANAVPTASHALSDFLAAAGTVARDPFQQRAAAGRACTGTAPSRRLRLRPAGRPPAGRAARRARARRAPAAQLRHRPRHDRAARGRWSSSSCRTRTPTPPTSASTTLPDQSKTLANRCAAGASNDPLARGTWGVATRAELLRRLGLRRLPRTAARAARSPRSPALFELSEPETRNLAWVASTFPSIRFAVDLQSNGGYLTWSPGAYVDNGSRTPLPRPSAVVDDYMAQTAARVVANLASPPRPGDPAAAHRQRIDVDRLGGGQRDRPALGTTTPSSASSSSSGPRRCRRAAVASRR